MVQISLTLVLVPFSSLFLFFLGNFPSPLYLFSSSSSQLFTMKKLWLNPCELLYQNRQQIKLALSWKTHLNIQWLTLFLTGVGGQKKKKKNPKKWVNIEVKLSRSAETRLQINTYAAVCPRSMLLKQQLFANMLFSLVLVLPVGQ